MKSRIRTLIYCSVILFSVLTGCGRTQPLEQGITLTTKFQTLEEGLTAVSIEGEDGFLRFLEAGGAENDGEVVSYLQEELLRNMSGLSFQGNPYGCSTLCVKTEEEGYYFGRNFDWNRCHALIVRSVPKEGYSSISTVNTDFIQSGGMNISNLPDEVQALLAVYAPLDGMNEKGLAVSVNMIQDGETISQNTDKKDITTTTAVRLLLNQASDVEEAVSLLEEYDMHASMNMMVHFAIADVEGNSVVVEYIHNRMTVTETKIVTNFYLTEGEKYGIGTAQSHERYEIMEQAMTEHESMSAEEVRDVLDLVSKDNFQDTATTEWSIVMDLGRKEATYYHREDYTKGYRIRLNQ